MSNFESLIRDVPDFPKEGIIFKDITPLLMDPQGFKDAVSKMAEPFKGKSIDLVVGAEARGFIFGPPIAFSLGAGFVPIRKPGKLPYKTESVTYDLEYGSDTLQIHKDAIKNGQNVLVVDDLLATGGTMSACCKLVESLDGKVAGCTFLIELGFLNGKDLLNGYEVASVIKY